MPGIERDAGSGLISVESALKVLGIGVSNNGSVKVEKLSGGLTNDNVVVTLQNVLHEERKIVLRRFLAKTSAHLGYDRQQEYDNSRFVANRKKIGAPVIGYVPATDLHGGALAVTFIEGRTLNQETIREMSESEGGMSRLVNALKRLHERPALFKNHFDPFKARVQYEYEVKLLTGKAVAWEGYADLVKRLEPVQEYLERDTEDLVDCHNDLLAANFLDSGSNLTIIDWELSGQSQPSWELGNFISENGLDGTDCDAIVSTLIAQYWKDQNDDSAFVQKKIKRARLFSLVSKITWAAWGAVLHNLDRKDTFDYQEWCMLRIQKAKLLLDDQDTIDRLCND